MPSYKFSSRSDWRAVLPVAAIIPSILAFCLSIPGAAQTKPKDITPWITKDWTQWNEDDCKAVLGKSPWVHGLPARGFGEQLRSALPIRQALLRKLQLDQFYDRMEPDKKLTFDRAHEHDLDPTDRVVIDIWNSGSETRPIYGSTIDTGGVSVDDEYPPLQSYSYTQAFPVRQVVLRLADGALIQPTEATVVHMDSLRKEVQFSFPRTIGNAPVLSPGETGLLFELGANLPTYIKTKRGNFKQSLPFRFSGNTFFFATSDLTYKGKLEY